MKKSMLLHVILAGGILTLVGCASDGTHPHGSHKYFATHHHGHMYYYDTHRGVYTRPNHAYPTNRVYAETRMSQTPYFKEGWDDGCRTAWTGGMYKNPRMHSYSQPYQFGWHQGFNKCRNDRTTVDPETDTYTYIPY